MPRRAAALLTAVNIETALLAEWNTQSRDWCLVSHFSSLTDAFPISADLGLNHVSSARISPRFILDLRNRPGSSIHGGTPIYALDGTVSPWNVSPHKSSGGDKNKKKVGVDRMDWIVGLPKPSLAFVITSLALWIFSELNEQSQHSPESQSDLVKIFSNAVLVVITIVLELLITPVSPTQQSECTVCWLSESWFKLAS